MAGTSVNLSNSLLDSIFNGADRVAPSNVYVSLHTADPGLTDATAGANELSGGSYARQDSGNSWTQTDNDTRTSNQELNFDMTGVAGTTVRYFALWSSASGESGLLASAQLGSDVTFQSGDTITFASGAIHWDVVNN